ncbi:MAG: PTS sugar transporter subunit IIA [Deltaproteobacteria bacterium]|jgi:PTS system nitrogen regulatory IIA component|nr:PTS sugar transporter subunit IIA [Deltaproteobacteria bacterium]MBW2265196.1 PTS sugar transporter subunit IIA [Deltaproteobacteria bacterium]MBW2317314.1 PTS sugar transporter subunit IIA [Deltaproteobacteria bacterium]MBW2601542.1 PTS sugar transporter subunit IIA [Deltaproteobacteria bacterium]OEU46546.1 MAG: PTS fructose transporter subunit IIA [Desulfobacterales bacterium S7086C20]
MKILDNLNQKAIISKLNATDKNGVLNELSTALAEASGGNQEEMMRVLLDRERLGSTGIGGGIAIPHGKMKSLDSLSMAFGRSHKGVNFETMDGKPAYLFFLLLAPQDSTGGHLKMLARISQLLKDSVFKERLINAADQRELYATFEEEDKEF